MILAQAFDATYWGFLGRGVGAILLYAVLGALLMLLGFYAVDLTTPGKLTVMVREGRPNAVVITAAGMVSMAFIVVTAIYTSSGFLTEGLIQTLVFGLVGILAQVGAVRLLEWVMRIDIGAAEAGTGARAGDRSKGVTTWNLNAITPETETTSHYFWAQAQDFAGDDPTVSELDFSLVHSAFQEDLAMIKGQQENIDIAPAAPRLDLAADRAGIQARRIAERMIRAEAEAAPERRSA